MAPVRRPRVPLGAALLTALAIAGCGGSSPPKAKPLADLLPRTAVRSERYASNRFTMSMSLKLQSQVAFDFSGSGVIAAHGRLFSAHLLLMNIQTSHGALPQLPEDVIADGDQVFYRFLLPQLVVQMPRGRPWVKSSAASAAQQVGGLGENDPSRLVDYLRAAAHTARVGREIVSGTPTTHYIAQLVLAKVQSLTGAPSSLKNSAVIRAAAGLGIKQIPLEVWIDDRGLLRRERVDWTLVNPSNSSQTATLHLFLELSDYGTRAAIHVPPASASIPESRFTRLAAGTLS